MRVTEILKWHGKKTEETKYWGNTIFISNERTRTGIGYSLTFLRVLDPL